MTFSGTNVATTISLQANTVTDETQLAGKGSFGPFTFRELHADGAAPQPPSDCMGPSFGVLKGAGVFRFQDGSLLIATVMDGFWLYQSRPREHAALTVNYQVNGGSGRFRGASGNLRMTAQPRRDCPCYATLPTRARALDESQGSFEGTIVGPALEDEERGDERD